MREKYKKQTDAISGTYSNSENPLSLHAKKFARRTIIRTPNITTMLTTHVAPKYREIVVMLFISNKRKPAPRKKKWRSSRLFVLSKVRKIKSKETTTRNPMVMQ